jgi:hypothetical protein
MFIELKNTQMILRRFLELFIWILHLLELIQLGFFVEADPGNQLNLFVLEEKEHQTHLVLKLKFLEMFVPFFEAGSR